MHIALFSMKEWTEGQRQQLQDSLGKHEVQLFNRPLTKDTAHLAAEAQIVSVFIDKQIDEQILDQLPQVQLLATRSTGFDHIDVEACKKNDIAVANVPYYAENTVAEHTFALIMALSRNTHRSYCRAAHMQFSPKGLEGFELKGRTLGIIGTGRIGLHVIQIARGFNMRVLAYEVKQDPFLAKVLNFQYTDLDTLLSQSDIVSLHVPSNPHTHHLMDEATIGKMKAGAILINTARGDIVDTDALLDALMDGHLQGAGLDVLEGEDLVTEDREAIHDAEKAQKLQTLARNHMPLKQESVVFTPHIAFYSEEALQRVIATTIDNINSFIAGRPQNLVVGGEKHAS